MPNVPNQPKTPVRSLRVDDPLWSLVERIANTRNASKTSVVVAALTEYAERWLVEQGEDPANYLAD